MDLHSSHLQNIEQLQSVLRGEQQLHYIFLEQRIVNSAGNSETRTRHFQSMFSPLEDIGSEPSSITNRRQLLSQKFGCSPETITVRTVHTKEIINMIMKYASWLTHGEYFDYSES